MAEDGDGAVHHSSRPLPDDNNFEDVLTRNTYETRTLADPLDERLADTSSIPMNKTTAETTREQTIGGGSEDIVSPGQLYVYI